MALTDFQRTVCRLISATRIESGVSYVAGGAALNELLRGDRRSRDNDLFHDTEEAVQAAWESDRALLVANRFRVMPLRERPSFVEARVSQGAESVLLQWARDSAFRFFPLVEHDELGLTLHPFDLATNKVLAMVGRLEVRDWIDAIQCERRLQPLGYLAWAACGKDPGFSPGAIIELAAKTTRYTAADLAGLDFASDPPDLAALSREWHDMVRRARSVVSTLPVSGAGTCVLTRELDLFSGDESELRTALARGEIIYHAGTIEGALPQIR